MWVCFSIPSIPGSAAYVTIANYLSLSLTIAAQRSAAKRSEAQRSRSGNAALALG